MAAKVGMSVSHFSNLFRRQFGVSPHRYVLHCRLQHATKILLMSELSIADVVYESGFADQAHLSRHFRGAFDVSPLQFRRVAGGVIGKNSKVQWSVRHFA